MRSLKLATVMLLALPALAAAAPATSDVEVYTPRGGEPEIAVNPRNPQNIVMGENVDGVAASFDGGAHWTQVPLPNIGDNTLAVEPDGTFLFTSINGTIWSSKTGGLTWEDVGNWVGAVAEAGYSHFPNVPYPANVGGGDVVREVSCDTPNVAGAGPVTTDPPPAGPGVQSIGCDRPWLATDPQTGRAYLSFSDHEDASGGTGGSTLPWELGSVACRGDAASLPFQCGRQYVAASGDGGHTWTKFQPMDSSEFPAAVTKGWSSGPVASFGRLATAYVAKGKDCGPCIVFETSTDDGAHWERHIVAPVELPANTAPTCAAFGCGDGGNLTTSLNFEPYTAADPSRPGRYAVMVFDAAQTKLLVYVTRDYGVTWDEAALAEPGDGVQRWVPWIAYGPSGALGAMWLTSYADGSFDAWAGVSPSGSERFKAPVPLSSARSPGPVAPGGDDASDVTLTDDTLYATWGDQRGGPAPTGWFGSYSDRVASYRFADDSEVRP